MRINKEQYMASKPDLGVNLVLAGAGTGKTTTMINKIKNVIQHNIAKPENILILTFSNKAAAEIKERLMMYTATDIKFGFSGTFHSFALHLLLKYKSVYLKHKGFRSFPVIIEKYQKEHVIKQLIMEKPCRFLGLPADVILNLLENLQYLNKILLKKLQSSELYNEICKLKVKFDEYKHRNNLFEFDDMINHVCDIIQLNPFIKYDISNTYYYFFIDEFQDTSINNFAFLSLLISDNNKNIFIVGDDYQSIYKFRHAKIDYIINLKKFFPETKIYKLTLNYRSRKEIVKIADKFIRINKFRSSKKIISWKGAGGTVLIHHAYDMYHESEIIKKILINEKPDTNVAILYRNNYQGDFLKKIIKFTCYPLKINLLTMHSSKGLEFNTVIIAGICDKIIPDRTSDIEEERRLFYVAMTRAEEKLHLIYYRNDNGSMPRFIKESGFNDT